MPFQNNLGWMYKNGKGVDQNFEEAIKWHRKAAKQGDAQNNLGWMYEYGKGVDQDFEKLFTGIQKLRYKVLHQHKIIWVTYIVRERVISKF